MRRTHHGHPRGEIKTRTLIGLAVLGIVLTLLVRVQMMDVARFEVTSESMEPTLPVGARLMMSPRAEYAPGDVVVLDKPGAPESLIVKRIVAKGPGRVALEDGLLYVNGDRHDPPQGPAEPVQLPDYVWQLREGQFFVVGDNRAESRDSRDFGPVERDAIRGVADRSNLATALLRGLLYAE